MQLPLPENEVARLEVLGRYQIFGTPPEECFDNITHLAAYVCGTPIALISLIDQNSQWFKSRVGCDVDEIPRGVSLCAQTILQSEAAKYFFRADTDVSFLSGSLVLIRRTFDVKSPEIVLPKLSTMVPSIGAGYCGPISCPMQGVEIDGSEFSVESVPIWKTSGRTFCRYPLAPRTCWLRTGSD